MKINKGAPLIPMTAITGKPDKKTIHSYLDEILSAGIESLMLYPRSGCELVYMSEEWFDTVRVFIEGAAARGMKVWLYDDFNWPSGDAAGLISKTYHLKAVMTEGEERGKIIDYSTHNAHLFGVKHFPDLLSREAVDAFIASTHEKYYERFSEHFGKTVVGIFTDEPSMAYCCRSLECADEEGNSGKTFDTSHGLLPYYDGMAEDYKTQHGRGLFEDIEMGAEGLVARMTETVSRRFRETYIGMLAEWCQSHGIIMTGHLWLDDEPVTSVRANGDFLAALSAFGMPGMDEIETSLKLSVELPRLSSVQYARSENGAMAELFALGPCDMSYSKRLSMLYLCAAFGVDSYFLAISPLDARGNYKITDFFNYWRAAQPDFVGMRAFADEARRAATLAALNYTPDVLVRYPYSASLARMMKSDSPSGAYEALLAELAHHQASWKVISEGDIADKGIPVIDFTDNFEYVLNGKVNTDAVSLAKLVAPAPLVTDENGALPNGLFIRKYDSGELIVINLEGEDGVYLINGSPVRLEKFGSYISGDVRPDFARAERADLTLDVSYNGSNITRLMFPNGATSASFELEEDCEVELIVRRDAVAMLDGMSIKLDTESGMPVGFEHMYQSSEPLSLSRGVHTVLAEGKDHKYLPSVLLRADASVRLNVESGYIPVLSERKTILAPRERITGEYGRIDFSAEVEIPENAEAIMLSDTVLCTEVYLDGESLGMRIRAPFVFDIPEKLRSRRATIRITQYSSIGEIFGDTRYYDDVAEHLSWRGTPPTSKTLFGADVSFLISR